MAGDKIEAAKSGRAACRKCKEKIGKGELRFGEVDYSFDEKGSFKWFHLPCAAEKHPVKFMEALGAHEGEVEGKAELLAKAAECRRGNAYPRGELAPSGRASCRACEEKIAKAELRVAVLMEADVGPARAGYLHAACAKGSELLAEVEDLSTQLQENSALEADKLAELVAALA